MGWRNGENPGIRTAFSAGRFHCVCDQLRAPGLPGALVFRVATVHVPVPRRRVLRGWEPGIGASRARPVYVRTQTAGRETADQCRADADIEESGQHGPVSIFGPNPTN